MGAQHLLRLRCVVWIGNPPEDVLEGAAAECGGVEVGLQHLGALGGVEASCLVACASGHGSSDGAGGERLGAALCGHRVLAPGDRVPHQLRCAGHEVEGVEHRHRSAVRAAMLDGEQEVLGLGERHQRRAGVGQQRGREQVEGLAGALGTVDAGGPVVRHPQLHPARDG